MDDNQKEFNEALKAFTESLHSSNTALTDSEKEAKKFTSDLKSEFDKLGITLKSNNDLEDTRAAKTKRRLEVEEEVNKKLIESGKVRNREEAESYKKTLRAQEAEQDRVIIQNQRRTLNRLNELKRNRVAEQLRLDNEIRQAIARNAELERGMTRQAYLFNQQQTRRRNLIE